MIKGLNYINGQFQNDSKGFKSYNPSNESVIGEFVQSTKKDIDSALAAAKSAQKKWAATSKIRRGEYFENVVQIIRQKFNTIVEAISLETGKSLNESTAEVNEAIHMCQYTFSQSREQSGKILPSEIAEKEILVFKKPKGVVAVISPWNFPFAINFWTTAPSLLEGNTVIMKPSEETPYVGELIADIYHEAGLPNGVFNLVHGDGEVGKFLVESDVNHICFTGSAEVGKTIKLACANSWNKSCSCELGSKSAVVVFNDADLDLSVKASVLSAFKLSGQRCVSSGRILVQKEIFDKFVAGFVEQTKQIKVGNPFDNSDMGPLISKTQMEKVVHYNTLSMYSEKLLLKGDVLFENGWFLSPHVYIADWGNKPYLKEEVFGPHVALIPFTDTEEAVSIYNDTEYGLSLSVCTNDMVTAKYMRDNCDFGMGYLNLPSIGAESHSKFGGIKKSGYGGSSAAGTFQAVTNEITWTNNYNRSGFVMAQGLK